ncbi:hypothetical protein Bca4012_031384 [Brassica carinata]|uniref:DUF7780 domain-containing protein n=4 Tax=Brassica TaxID=3705 RepID=A0A0D3BXA4_BRAOL|nr:PREDICTED: uncharacterized protein LOC106337389 [Brassica oleracea var. oleracea]XP_022556648.1 uncharacterized protein LOC111205296 [Brassica napus]KAG2287802.1 hypothetical protein Bca52824_047406 [Brassica carinata]CAF1849329.1 unnamed protein product [Brassica napus]VDD09606.1 unnamed protein product [Brassica oleracea]
MGLISSTKETKNSGRGMGFLFVFFPDHNNDDSPSSSSSPATTLFRTRSSRLLLSKAQSTISICILLLLLTLFLFTLSTFEPSSGFPAVSPRRFLLTRDVAGARRRSNRFALQGMGTLFLRGTKSMHDLIVAHIASDTTEQDLRLFMRLLHRSGVTSRSDVVLLFNSHRFNALIEEENSSFSKLVNLYRNSNQTETDSVWGFNLTRFTKNQSKKDTSEPIWGKKTHRANNETESDELTHGSIVGFDVAELDPENSLSGFMDHVPIALRRWACYPMLLGRVRRNFKRVMLVDAKTSLILGDPLTRIRNRSPESILFFSKHSNKINPAVIIGGAKGIRRLSSAMHTEIARATIQQQQHKKRSLVSESGVLSQLVGNVHMTKGFEVVGPSEVIAEASSLAELRTRNSTVASSSIKSRDIIQRGNSNHFDITATIMKRICSSVLDSSVYSYC